MTPDWIIARKRDGEDLHADEIHWFISEFASGRLPDYQMAALAMAIYLRGMSTEETVTLTQAMLDSGIRLEWPDITGPLVDKHSTGGIGDKVSLILAPWLASCGCFVPMISGRGLGATGGTLDKLEAIPGFRTDLSIREIQSTVTRVGCVITGATRDIAPADRELYALRDVTATVASVPLITASILSKKLAEGIKYLVLDVKFGTGAFMKTRQHARELAVSLTRVGQRLGVATSAVLSDMNQPLGQKVGNALEVDESWEVLRGEGPADTRLLTQELASRLMVDSGVSASTAEAWQRLDRSLASGQAREKFEQMVALQGGDVEAARPIAPPCPVRAEHTGFIDHIDAQGLGRAVIHMGGGRKRKGDRIDHSVGLEVHARVGDPIEAGQIIATVHAQAAQREAAVQAVQRAFSTSLDPPSELPKLIQEWIVASG